VKSLITAVLLIVFGAASCAHQSSPLKTPINLPSSKVLFTPVPGRTEDVGSQPVTVALSPDGLYLAILENGFGTSATGLRQGISIVDLRTNAVRSFPDSRLKRDARQTYFLGLAFGSDGSHLYASVASITDPVGSETTSTGNGVAVYSFARGLVAPERFLSIPMQTVAAGKVAGPVSKGASKGQAVPYPAGLAVAASSAGDRVLIADNLSDDALLIDAVSGQIVWRFDLSTRDEVPASYPYSVVVQKDGRRAWCSLWNGSSVVELDLETGHVIRRIALRGRVSPTEAGSHPTAMLLSPNEKLLYVALSNADEVAVVDATSGIPIGWLDTRLHGQRFGGAYPDALAQSSDGKRLFVADASSNAIAIFHLADMQGPTGFARGAAAKAAGFISTEWYPTALAVRGDDLFVASGKAKGTGPNGPPERAHPYIAILLHGSITRIGIADAEANLAALTREVEESNRMMADADRIAFKAGANPIRHVIYIIKENRTYDQVLGDLGVGNGDPSLTIYGEEVTPNQHALARQFGVLDNFYASGEVSGDGHVWATAAITSDYTEKTWQIAYRGHERAYDYEGRVSDEIPLDHGQPDVNEPGTGYLWTHLARNGLTYRHYGEYISSVWCDRDESRGSCRRNHVDKGQPLPESVGEPHGSRSPWPWAVPVLSYNRATKPELRDHFDPHYPDFRLEYPDQLRADEFLNEFGAFVRAREEGRPGLMPALIVLRLPNDHTIGTRPGFCTPKACVADNDLALGRVVDAVSHSPYWDDTALFVIEDDAQNGADHVDAHRSPAFVISKFAPGATMRKGSSDPQETPYVASQFYTTVNLVRTMEVLLGLPPMNNNDAHAVVMAPLFSGEGNQPPFDADFRNRDNKLIYAANSPDNPDAPLSMSMDFSHADAADFTDLNRILWRDANGDTPMPPPRYAVIPVRVRRGADGRDD